MSLCPSCLWVEVHEEANPQGALFRNGIQDVSAFQKVALVGEGDAVYRDTGPPCICVHTRAHTPSLPTLYSQALVGLPCKQGKSGGLSSRAVPWEIAGFVLFWLLAVWLLQWQWPHHLTSPADSHPVPPVLTRWSGHHVPPTRP